MRQCNCRILCELILSHKSLQMCRRCMGGQKEGEWEALWGGIRLKSAVYVPSIFNYFKWLSFCSLEPSGLHTVCCNSFLKCSRKMWYVITGQNKILNPGYKFSSNFIFISITYLSVEGIIYLSFTIFHIIKTSYLVFSKLFYWAETDSMFCWCSEAAAVTPEEGWHRVHHYVRNN